MDRFGLIKYLNNYSTSFEDEKEFIPRFLELLQQPDCFLRSNLHAHITGSAWIVNHHASAVLLMHHRKLDKWLQPGGHADGDENVLRVALKEAEEETGINEFEEIRSSIFDIDIHTIPYRKDVPEHYHFDIRFFLRTKENEQPAGNHESHAISWIDLDKIHLFTGGNRSISRMAEKTKGFFSTK